MQLISSLQTIIFEYVFPRDVGKMFAEILVDGKEDMHMLLLIMERLKTTRREFMLHSRGVFRVVSLYGRLDVMVCLCMQFKPSLEEFMDSGYGPFTMASNNGYLEMTKYIVTHFELVKKLAKWQVMVYGIGAMCKTKNIKLYEWLRKHFDLTFNEYNIISMFKHDPDFPKFEQFETIRPIVYFIIRLCERGEPDAAIWIYKALRWTKFRITSSICMTGTYPGWDKFHKWYHALPDS